MKNGLLGAGAVVGKGLAAVDDAIRAWKTSRDGGEAAPRVVGLPPDLAATIRSVLEKQREVMDRTAQAAFAIKQAAGHPGQGPGPGPGEARGQGR